MEWGEVIYFKNRKDAGEKLGTHLRPLYKELKPLVIGVPRGGFEVAWYISRKLHADLSMVISKKLPMPGNPELGFGAVSEGGLVYVADMGIRLLDQLQIDRVIKSQTEEIIRRVKQFRTTQLPDMNGRVVIIADDGIATGVTLVPVIRLCRERGASKIIIAAPVSGRSYDEHLEEADRIEILVQPPMFYAVGQVYKEFSDFTDSQVQMLAMRAGLLNQT